MPRAPKKKMTPTQKKASDAVNTLTASGIQATGPSGRRDSFNHGLDSTLHVPLEGGYRIGVIPSHTNEGRSAFNFRITSPEHEDVYPQQRKTFDPDEKVDYDDPANDNVRHLANHHLELPDAVRGVMRDREVMGHVQRWEKLRRSVDPVKSGYSPDQPAQRPVDPLQRVLHRQKDYVPMEDSRVAAREEYESGPYRGHLFNDRREP